MNGIPFVPSMVRALIERRKTVFRRTIMPQPIGGEMPEGPPRFESGMLLWVRERYRMREGLAEDAPVTQQNITFAGDATDAAFCETDWCPALSLPRVASRLSLLVCDVRRERIQEITEAEALREGVCEDWYSLRHPIWRIPGTDIATDESARAAYAQLWQQLHANSEAWSDNPYVYRVEARLIRCNIELLERTP